MALQSTPRDGFTVSPLTLGFAASARRWRNDRPSDQGFRCAARDENRTRMTSSIARQAWG
jgi:hypothetical protein